VAPDGTKAYFVVDTAAANEVVVIDADSGAYEELARITVGTDPFGIALSSDGATAYVSGFDGVNVIDTATNTMTALFAGAHARNGKSIAVIGSTAYLARFAASSVTAIDTTTGALVAARSFVGFGPWGITALPDGSGVVAVGFSNIQPCEAPCARAWVLDADTLDPVIDAVPLAGVRYSVAVSPDGAWAMTPDYQSNTFSVIDLATGVATDGPALGIGQSAPHSVAVSPDGESLYVSLYGRSSAAIVKQAELPGIESVSIDGDLRVGASLMAVLGRGRRCLPRPSSGADCDPVVTRRRSRRRPRGCTRRPSTTSVRN
jgi:DNA-binding beta-propeller fold protein YncE